MAEREVQFKLSADAKEVVEELKKIVDSAKKTGAETETAFGGIKEAIKTVSTVITGINQATELVRKGFDALKNSILGPLERIKDLVTTGSAYVREFEKVSGVSTEAGRKITELDRNLGRLRATIGSAIAATPEFSGLLDLLNDRLTKLTVLIGSNLPAVSKLFGAAINFAVAGALAAVQKLKVGFDLVTENIERVIALGRKVGIFSDPIQDLVDDIENLQQHFASFTYFTSEQQNQVRSIVSAFEAVKESGDFTSTALQKIRDSITTLVGGNTRLESQTRELLDEAAAQLDILIAKGAALEAANQRLESTANEVTAAYNELAPALQGAFDPAGLAADFRAFTNDAIAQTTALADKLKGGVEFKVDSDELKRAIELQREAAQGHNVLKAAIEQGAAPKIEGNIADLVPQLQQVGLAFKATFDELNAEISQGVSPALIKFTGDFQDAAVIVRDSLAAAGAGGVDASLAALDELSGRMGILQKEAPAAAASFDDLRAAIAAVGTQAAAVDGTTVTVHTKIDSEGGASGQSPQAAAAVITEASSQAAGVMEDAAAQTLEAAERLDQAGQDAGSAQQDAANAGNAAAAALAQSATSLTTAADLGSSAARAIDLAADGLQGAAQSVKAAGDAFAGILKGGSDAEAGALIKSAGDLSGSARELNDAAGAIAEAARRLQLPGDQLGGIVTSPRVSVVGEAGPELILPLNSRGVGFLTSLAASQGQGGGGFGAAGITVLVSNNTFVGFDDLVSQVERQIADRLQSVEVRV